MFLLQMLFALLVVVYVVPKLFSFLKSWSVKSSRDRAARITRQKGRDSIAALDAALREKQEGGQKLASWTLDPLSVVASRARRSHGDAMALLCDVLCRTLKSNRQLNCVTSFTKPLAELEEEVDDLFSGSGAKKAPGMLHGLPVSIKECFSIEGQDTTIGCGKRCGKPAAADAVIATVLRRQGAVVYARTNVPQTMLSYECSNPVYGQTLNPYDPTRGPGGSSGGEGALIGSHGSLLGIGSDIGGSCRIPAAFSGCCGFKPTAGRLSSVGAVPGTPGQESIKSTAGPMAREVDGLVLLLRALLGDGHMHALDPTVPDLPFDDAKYGLPLPGDANRASRGALFGGGTPGSKKPKQRLRIGWFCDDGFAPATPACARAVAEARDALAARGHTLVEWRDVKSAGFGVDALTLFALLLGADGAATLTNLALKDDTVDPTLKELVILLGMPKVMRWISTTVSYLLGWTRISRLVGRGGHKSTEQTWAIQWEKKHFVAKVLASWKAMELDAVVCPSGVMPATYIGHAGGLSSMCCYTAFFNLLDMPAGVVPVTTATAADDAALLSSYPRKDPWDKRVVAAASGAAGLPVGVQVAALPWEDEMCLRVMKEVEDAAAFRPSGGQAQEASI